MRPFSMRIAMLGGTPLPLYRRQARKAKRICRFTNHLCEMKSGSASASFHAGN
jgi:hypothetical protein